MSVKDANGEMIEAYDIMQCRKFAELILMGSKPIEFRDVTKHWWARLSKAMKQFDPKEIYAIHFHDRGNTWFLDVMIEGVDLMPIHPDSRGYFLSHGCHDYDNVIEDIERSGFSAEHEKTPWAFCLPIIGLINYGGTLADICPNPVLKPITKSEVVIYDSYEAGEYGDK